MIKDYLDTLIMSAMKEGNKTELNTYRAIKTKFMEHKTAKNAIPLTEEVEILLIRKMVIARNDAAEKFKECGRFELAEIELAESGILQKFLPAEVSDEDILKVIKECGIEYVMKNMGSIIKYVKEKLPFADGKKVSDLVRIFINKN